MCVCVCTGTNLLTVTKVVVWFFYKTIRAIYKIITSTLLSHIDSIFCCT